jgi:poly(beta-D-mannuronate) lyase
MVATFGVMLTSQVALATTTSVSSLEELQRAIEKAVPGDHVVMADGKYETRGPITVTKAGTEQQPIVIEAKTVGAVEIGGAAGFQLKAPAAYVVVKGFVFTHKASMRLETGAQHCRVTRNLFALKVDTKGTYVDVVGDDNEIDHNTFRDKDTEGEMLIVQGPAPDKVTRRTWIHHNYFVDFRNSHKNNASAIQIGLSSRSMDSAFSVVEHNLFVRTVGENEGAVCNKSCDNIYRYNTIVDCTELSIRHGHRVQAYGNFVFNSDGIRFFAHDHEIYSNYFEGCHPAINIGNGDGLIPPAKLTAHQRPERVKVVYNTFVDNKTNVQMAGRKDGLGAVDITVANNLIVGGPKAMTIAGPFEGAKLEGNVLWQTEPGDLPAGAFVMMDPGLTKDDRGVRRIANGSPLIGKGLGKYDFVKVDVDGQPRGARLDVGADQVSGAGVANRPSTEAEVGPKAAEEGRALISAPRAEWMKQ